MTDRQTQHTHARIAAEEDAGFDVWLPAIVAFAAALFLILSASAQEAAPRPIFNAERFSMSETERTMLEEHAARAAVSADDLAHTANRFRAASTRVEMLALPELHAAVADGRAAAVVVAEPVRIEIRSVLIADTATNDPSPGWLRLVMALTIAAMLGGALFLLDRTWRRTGPFLPNEQTAA